MKDVKQRSRRRRQRRRSQDHKRSVLAISAVADSYGVCEQYDVKGEEQRISGAGDRTERADPGRKRPVKRDQRIR